MTAAIYLRAQSARCLRLARGSASPRLASELEELGQAFEQEAREAEDVERQRKRPPATAALRTEMAD